MKNQLKYFNYGDMMRDFTYIDDIVESILCVLDKPATPDASFDADQLKLSISDAPYRIFNIGNTQPEKLMDFIAHLEQAIGKVAQKEFLPMQPGDVKVTYADTSALESWIGLKPDTPLSTGVDSFGRWNKSFYLVQLI